LSAIFGLDRNLRCPQSPLSAVALKLLEAIS